MEENENKAQIQETSTVPEKKKSKKGLIAAIIAIIVLLMIAICVGIGAVLVFKGVFNKNNSGKTSESTQSNGESICVKVVHEERNKNDGENYCIDVYGYDKDGKEIWKYTTVEGISAQYLNVEFLGENNQKVYLNEKGTIVALDRNTGKVLWKNSEYNGYSTWVDELFDKDGNLYLVSMSTGPDLLIVDSNGKTKKKFDHGELNKSLGQLTEIKIDSNNEKLIMVYALPYGVSEYENTLTMKLSDYTYTVEKKDVGEYKYDENGLVIMDDYSGISSFWGKWENQKDGTEITIGQQDIFVLDHYTKASEVLGTCIIKGNKIELVAENGQRWNGELMGQKDKEKFVLKVKIDGKDVIFEHTDTNGKLIEKTEKSGNTSKTESNYAEEYTKILDKAKAEYGNDIKCDLIYFNNDDIPDLVVGVSGYWTSLYMYEDGKVYTIMDKAQYGIGGSKYFDYYEKKGVIFNYGNSYAGAIGYQTYYVLNSNKKLDELEFVCEGAEVDESDSQYEEIQKALAEEKGWYFNGKKISEQEFNNKLKEYSVSIDTKENKDLYGSKTIEEVKKQLQ